MFWFMKSITGLKEQQRPQRIVVFFFLNQAMKELHYLTFWYLDNYQV